MDFKIEERYLVIKHKDIDRISSPAKREEAKQRIQDLIEYLDGEIPERHYICIS